MKIKTTFLILCVIFLTANAWGQIQDTGSESSPTRVNLERTIYLRNDSKSEEVIIKIEDKTKKLDLLVNSGVAEGKLTIEIYDPKGKKQGNFAVGTQLDIAKENNSSKSEEVHGNISKSIKEPQVGNWKVKLIPINARATVKIQTTLIL